MKNKYLALTIVFVSLIINPLISGLIIESVSTSPDLIAPGEHSSIRLGIENNGDKTIRDISVSLNLKDLSFAPFNSATEFNIEEIKENRIKFAEFEIMALNDAKPGVYKIPVEISYKKEGENIETTQESLISLTVNSKPIVDISIEEGLLLNGQENKVAIKIVNKGLSDAKFLEIELQGGTSYSILGPNKVYMGDIGSDDFDSAEFTILLKESSISLINFPVIVSYKDVLNKEYKENFELQKRAYTAKEATDLGLIAKNNTATYIVVVVFLIVVYLLYRRWRKKRKLKKANSLKEETY